MEFPPLKPLAQIRLLFDPYVVLLGRLEVGLFEASFVIPFSLDRELTLRPYNDSVLAEDVSTQVCPGLWDHGDIPSS